MLVLGIDTSTLVCSVALLSDRRLLGEITFHTAQNHSRSLVPMIDRLMRESGTGKGMLEGVCVSLGPGSFTGLRIGVATAKGLAYSLGIPVAGVQTLDAMAFNVAPGGRAVCPVLDAKREQVYAALYRPEAGELKRTTDYMVIEIDHLIEKLKGFEGGVTLLGDATGVHGARFESGLGDRFLPAPLAHRWPRAACVAELGLRQLGAGTGADPDPFKLQPIYLRRSEAEVLWEKRSGASGEEARCGG